MIEWAQFPSTPDADFNVVGYYEAMKRLIWIAQNEAKKQAWAEIEQLARMQGDVCNLSAYPSGLKDMTKA